MTTTQIDLPLDHCRFILDSTQEIVLTADISGIITYCNKAAEKHYGYQAGQLIGKPFTMLYPVDSEASCEPLLASIMGDDFIEPMEVDRVSSSGTIFTVCAAISPLKDASGTLLGFSCVERILCKKSIGMGNSQAVLEGAPDAMVIIDPEGNIRQANQQTDRLFGYNRKELIGKRIETLLPHKFRKANPDFVEKYFRNPEKCHSPSHLELFGVTKTGRKFPVEISFRPLATHRGLLVSASIRDTTEKKRLEKKLIKTNLMLEAKVTQRTIELERRNKELEQFAYVASHDLQEPLRNISSLAQLLQSEYGARFDEHATKYLDYLVSATKRMAGLIKGLLVYSRIGREKRVGTVDCQALVTDVVNDLALMINEQNAVIHFKNLPLVHGNQEELKVVFQNLISNAVKFRRHDRRPEVLIEASEHNGMVEFAVTDNGIGIEEKHFKKIFLIFQRLHTESEFPGSGIGLAHCKKIIELHGGTISVESKTRVGSTFFFTIRK